MDADVWFPNSVFSYHSKLSSLWYITEILCMIS